MKYLVLISVILTVCLGRCGQEIQLWKPSLVKVTGDVLQDAWRLCVFLFERLTREGDCFVWKYNIMSLSVIFSLNSVDLNLSAFLCFFMFYVISEA